MRVKVVPPAPDDLDGLRRVGAALPLVPDGEESCCARLTREAGVADTETAREWLPFLVALGLAEEGPGGYSRVREEAGRDELAGRFREGVFAAEEALAALDAADEPLDAAAVFDELRDRVPTWERNRSADWEAVWRERTDRLLAWAALLGLAERAGDGFMVAGA